MTETPLMGSNRELSAKLINGFDTWVEFRKTSTEYHLILAKTSAQAFEEVMKELVALSERGEKVDSVRQLMNLWLDTIDHTFSKLYKSEEYLDVQRELSTAVMKYRLQEQEITEIVLKALNLPTRSELDDAYRSLYELRKEVKAIKKTLKEREGATAQVEATPAPKKTASKPAAKRKAATNQQATEEPAPEVASSGQ